jgi:hypothetical protein
VSGETVLDLRAQVALDDAVGRRDNVEWVTLPSSLGTRGRVSRNSQRSGRPIPGGLERLVLDRLVLDPRWMRQ